MLKSPVIALLAFILLLVVVGAADAATCPPDNVILPCTCSDMIGSSVHVTLNCAGKGLTDSRASEILQFFLTTPNVSPLGRLDMNNNPLLTRIPSEIKLFTQLGNFVQLNDNSITSIESDAFQFLDEANPIQNFYLNSNKLTTIVPGAFKGFRAYSSSTQMLLLNNKLTRFESTVFQSLLKKFAPYGGYPNANIQVSSNSFNCGDCHLAWLFRDNGPLLRSLVGGTCSNGTTFASLDANGFADCPSFVCPLGYDNYYPDPSNCSSYYVCSLNVAYHYNCPPNLVFNPDENRCDDVANVPDCDGNHSFVCPSADGYFSDPLSCTSYYLCVDNSPILLFCPPSLVFNPDKSQCDKPENVPSCN